jgi:hypothetical protein
VKCRIEFLFAFVLTITTVAWGRLQKPEEASHRFLNISQYYRIQKSGHYKNIVQFEVEILNETGRREFGFYKFTYAPYLSKIKGLEASTRNKDVTTKVDKNFIEDKPIASSKDGFDNDNQVSIAFPNVQVGSILTFNLEMETHTLALENFFSTIEYFGWRENALKQNLFIESERELFFHIKDPIDSLDLEVKNEGGKFLLNVTQKRPVFINPVEEKDPYLSRRLVPHVEVSTENNWGPTMLQPLISRYEDVLSATLPDLHQRIFQDAQKLGSDKEKIDFTIEQLQTHIRYLGDWRSVKGAMIPRSLSDTAKSGYGDCKDYSASLTAILRKLGYTSFVAWVFRGDTSKFENTRLPSIKIHNHAITYVELQGKPLWLDPTNNMVYTQETLPDIAGRPALILNPEMPKERNIPEVDFKKNRSLIQVEYSNIKGNYISVKTKLRLAGVAATEWTGDQLRSSLEALQFRMLEWTSSNVKTVKESKFEPFDLTSRIYNDLEFNYQFKELNPFYTTNQGIAFLLWENQALSQIADRVEKRFTDISLSYARTSEYILTFKTVSGQNTSKLNCSFKSKWVAFDRKVTSLKNGIRAHDKVQVLEPRVLAEDFESPEMKTLLSDIRKCMVHKALVLN